jgi:hypothetical protein
MGHYVSFYGGDNMQGTEKDALRELLTQNAKPLYNRALDSTHDPEKAKDILRTIVKESGAAAETRIITAEWLNELCDKLSEPHETHSEVTTVPELFSFRDEDLKDPEQTQELSPVSFYESRQETAEAASEETASENETEAEETERFGSGISKHDEQSRQVLPRRVHRTMPSEPYQVPFDRAGGTASDSRGYGYDSEAAESLKPYSLEEDDWINELREQRRRPERAEKGGEGSRGLYNLAIVLCIPLILILLWIVAGLLMKNGALPYSDLGYDWFNANFWALF